MSNSNNIYNILDKLNALSDKDPAPSDSTATKVVYENVEARGDIMQSIRSLEDKFKTFKESEDKPDFLDVDKDGDKKEPMKKAAKEKNARYKKSFQDQFGGTAGDLTKNLKVKEATEQLDELSPDTLSSYASKARGQGQWAAGVASPGGGVSDRDSAAYAKLANKRLAGAKQAEKKAGMDAGEAGSTSYDWQRKGGYGDKNSPARKHGALNEFNEAIDDLTDLDDYQFADPDKDTKVSPMTAKQAAADRRRRLQDLEDRRAEKDDWYDGKEKESNLRVHRAKVQDEPEELDEYSQAEYDQAMSDFKARGGKAQQLPAGAAKNPISTASRHIAGRGEAGKGKTAGRGANVDPAGKAVVDVYEKAPPGAKAERMVKHIKKGYADDGKLTKREKGIAYATAWKAHNKGQVEEGVEFGDTIKNSKAELKKAKKVTMTEGVIRNHPIYTTQEAWDHYAKELAEQETMEGATSHMHEPGIPSPTSVQPVTNSTDVELDEIAKLAGLPARTDDIEWPVERKWEDDFANDEDEDPMPLPANEDANGGASINGKAVNVNSIEVDGVNDWDSPDFADAYITYAEFTDGTPLNDDELDQLTDEHGELVNQAAHGSLQDRADFLDEEGTSSWKLVSPSRAGGTSLVGEFSPRINPAATFGPPNSRGDGYKVSQEWIIKFDDGTIATIYDYKGDKWHVGGHSKRAYTNVMRALRGEGLSETEKMGEGNEFSGALAAAKAAGAKEFEVDGKRYTVKEDVNLNITANGEEDAINLIRKLAGMPNNDTLAPAVGTISVAEIPSSQGWASDASMDEDREPDYVNTPHEKVAPIGAAIPSGTDMHRAKKSYSDKPYHGDNPMAVKETVRDTLWKKYTGMLKSLIK